MKYGKSEAGPTVRRTRRRLLPLMLGGGALVLAALSPAALAKTYVVKMTNTLKFVPAKVVIHKGDTVEWKNVSHLAHTATDVPSKAVSPSDASLPHGAKPFNSGVLKPGSSYRHTFKVTGTYHYFCIPHEVLGMLGTVIVKP